MRTLLCLLLLAAAHVGAQPLPGLIPFRDARRWGYCDSNRQIRISPRFSLARPFYKGRAVVALPGAARDNYCLINEQGNYVIPPEYHWTGYMIPGLRHAQLNASDGNGHWGMVDTAGHILVPLSFEPLSGRYGLDGHSFHNRPGYPHWFMIVAKDGKQGIIDTTGQTLLPFSYDVITEPASNDTLKGWIVQQNGQWGILHPNGTQWLPCSYESIVPTYKRGWIAVRVQGKMGVVDTAGHILVPFSYDSVSYPAPEDRTASGYAVMQGDAWGWYHIKNKQKVKPIYATPPYGTGKYVLVSRYTNSGTKTLLLDPKGKVLIPALYDRISVYPDSIVANNYMESEPGNGDWNTYSTLINLKTYKPVSWRKGCTDCFSAVMPAPQQIVSIEEEHYSINNNGLIIDTFSKDAMNWRVCGYVNNDTTNVNPFRRSFVYIVKAGRGKDTFYAVVDKQQQFIVAPQTNYAITGGDLPQQRLFVRRSNGQYMVTDLHFKWQGNPINRAISSDFNWKGRHYYIGSWKQGVEPRYSYAEKRRCFRCNCLTLLNSKGNIAQGFEAYCNVHFLTLRNEYSNLPQNNLLVVSDSMGREGVLNLDGKIQYPGISFIGKDLYFMGADILFLHRSNGQSDVTNTQGISLLGGKRIAHVSRADKRPVFTYNNAEDIPGLFTIHYYEPGSDNMEVVYADEHGTLYGINLK